MRERQLNEAHQSLPIRDWNVHERDMGELLREAQRCWDRCSANDISVLAMLRISAAGQVLLANPAAGRLFNRATSAMTGMAIKGLLSRTNVRPGTPSTDGYRRRVFRRGRSLVRVDVAEHACDDGTHWLYIKMAD